MKEKDNVRGWFSDTLFFTAANLVNLITTGGMALLIPKYIPVDDYGYYKLFFLFVSYVNMLHFGFINGVYVRWAGKPLGEVNEETGLGLRFLLLEQLAVMVPLAVLFLLLIHGASSRVVALMLLPAMLVNSVREFFYRTTIATRGFRFLSVIGVAFSILNATGILALILLGYHRFFHFTGLSLVMTLANMSILGLHVGKLRIPEGLRLSTVLAYGKENIGVGIFFMLGTLSSVLILGLDRLMVSAFFTIEEFAVYAFAMSLLTIVYGLINPVSDVLFPHLSAMEGEPRQRAYCLGKSLLVVIWGGALALFFPVRQLIDFYLPNYSASVPILQVLFCSVGFGAISLIIHQTCYAVYRKQRRLLLWGLVALAFSALLNVIALKAVGTMLSVAVANTVAFAGWYVLNERELWRTLSETRFQVVRDFGMMLTLIGAFWLADSLLEGNIGPAFLYMAAFGLVTFLAYRGELLSIVSLVRVRLAKGSVS